MTAIAVCPLSKLEATLQQTGATYLISLLGGDTEITRPDTIAANRHLVLRFNDISTAQAGLVCPAEHHISQLILFAKKWDREMPMLVHCWAGISRSPAAATIIALALEPTRDELELALTLRGLAAFATPNIKMIELADTILIRGGKLIDAVQRIGRGQDAFEGMPILLPITIDRA